MRALPLLALAFGTRLRAGAPAAAGPGVSNADGTTVVGEGFDPVSEAATEADRAHSAALDAAQGVGVARGRVAGPEVVQRLDAARPRLNVTAIAEGASLRRSMDDWAIAATLHAEQIVKDAPVPQEAPEASSDAWSTVGTAVADISAAVGSLAGEVQGAPADLQDVTAARAEFAQRAKPWAQWAAVLPAYTQVADAARARLEAKTGVAASVDAIVESGLARGPTVPPVVFPLQALQDQISQLEAKMAVGEERDAAAAAAVKQLAAELNSPGPNLAAAVKAAQAAQVGPPAPDRDLAKAMLAFLAQQGAFPAPPHGAVESAERRGELTAFAHMAEFLQRRVPAPAPTTPPPTPAPSPAAAPLEFRGARAVAAPGHAPAPESYGASAVHVSPDLDLVLDFSAPLGECASPAPAVACVLTISPTAASGQQARVLSVKDSSQVTVKGQMLRIKPAAPFTPGQYTLSVPAEAIGGAGQTFKLEFFVDAPSPTAPPTACKMSEWSSWSGCHLVGGQHVERRMRVVFSGAPDCAPTEESRPCNPGQATPTTPSPAVQASPAPAVQASPSPAAQALPATTPIPYR